MPRPLAILFIPGFMLIGAANAQHEWLGATAGGVVGLFFALGFMGLLPRWVVERVMPR
jgi:hypothetical protein